MWDNDGSGYLELEEVEVVMQKYKDGMENDCITKGTANIIICLENINGTRCHYIIE